MREMINEEKWEAFVSFMLMNYKNYGKYLCMYLDVPDLRYSMNTHMYIFRIS